jgi:hypothetical protein
VYRTAIKYSVNEKLHRGINIPYIKKEKHVNSPHLFHCLIIFLAVDRLSLQMKIERSSETVTSAATDSENPIRQGKDTSK